MEAPRSERATLSRDLSEFLIELSIALHRHSMYPSGHSALAPAVEGLVRRVERLLQERASIAFGVARRQLIIDGVTTDPDHPVLRRLAEGLHRHHIAAVSVMPGVEAYEISDALRALAAEADRDGALGLKRGDQAPAWPHVKLHPLTFDGLTLAGEAPSADGQDAQRVSHGAELWVGLAKAALSSEGGENADSAPAEPSDVARAINDHPGAEAFDQAIVGYLQQIAQELKTASGETAADLRRQTSRLIGSLKPGTLRRLVSMGGNQGQRDQFVLDATSGMAVDAVLEIVRAAADASGQTISHGLVRMLAKLATHAERGSDLVRPRADAELRDQVSRLLADWRLEDPNPEMYGRVLEHLATSTPPGTPRTNRKVAAEPEPLRIVQMSLEAGASGPLAEKAVDQAIHAGQLNGLLALLAAPPEGGEAGAEVILARLIRPETLREMLAGDRIDLAGLDHLLPRLPLEAYEPLLEALGTSPSRAVRRRLLELLSRTTVNISSLIIPRLDDTHWYVQRNMLMLLTRSGHVPEGFSVLRWTTHPDARVRSEAVRLQLTLPQERDAGVRMAITDSDPRIVHIGLTAIRDECPVHLVDHVIDLALTPESGEDIRLLSVKVLSRLRHESVLDALLRLADGGRSFFGRQRLPPKTPVLVAVIRLLSSTWSDDPRTRAVLKAAARSSDRELREAGSLTT